MEDFLEIVDILKIEVSPYKCENKFFWNGDNLNDIEFSQFRVWENTPVMQIIADILIAVYNYKNTKKFSVCFTGTKYDINIIEEAIERLNSNPEFRIQLLEDKNSVIKPSETIDVLRVAILEAKTLRELLTKESIQKVAGLEDRIRKISNIEINSGEVVSLINDLLEIFNEQIVKDIDNKIKNKIESSNKEISEINTQSNEIITILKKHETTKTYIESLQFEFNIEEYEEEKVRIDKSIEVLKSNIKLSQTTSDKKITKPNYYIRKITDLKADFVNKVDKNLNKALENIKNTIDLANSLSKNELLGISQFELKNERIPVNAQTLKKSRSNKEEKTEITASRFSQCLNEIVEIQKDFNSWLDNEKEDKQNKLNEIKIKKRSHDEAINKQKEIVETLGTQADTFLHIIESLADLRKLVK